jgi:hypothetical protein
MIAKKHHNTIPSISTLFVSFAEESTSVRSTTTDPAHHHVHARTRFLIDATTGFVPSRNSRSHSFAADHHGGGTWIVSGIDPLHEEDGIDATRTEDDGRGASKT